MLEQILIIVGGITSCALLFWVYQLKQNASSLHDKISKLELASKDQQKKLSHSHKALEEQKSKGQQGAKASKKLEKELSHLKTKLAEKEKEAHNKSEETQLKLSKALDQLEHYQSQCSALTDQLKSVDQDNRSFRLKCEEKVEAAETKLQEVSKKYKKEADELKKQFKKDDQDDKRLKSKLTKLEEQIKSADPLALKKAKSRANRNQQLYQIMRGHKEMLEERNTNWELALRILASWVLSSQKKSVESPEKLGDLVGGALEAIKSGSLMSDEFGSVKIPEDMTNEYSTAINKKLAENEAATTNTKPEETSETESNKDIEASPQATAPMDASKEPTTAL